MEVSRIEFYFFFFGAAFTGAAFAGADGFAAETGAAFGSFTSLGTGWASSHTLS